VAAGWRGRTRLLLAHAVVVVLVVCLASGFSIQKRVAMAQENATIEQVKDQHVTELMSIEGIEGVGIGEEEDRPVIKIYVSNASRELRQQVPTELEGYPVRIEVTGEFNVQSGGA
jgi:hypothetical protein